MRSESANIFSHQCIDEKKLQLDKKWHKRNIENIMSISGGFNRQSCLYADYDTTKKY